MPLTAWPVVVAVVAGVVAVAAGSLWTLALVSFAISLWSLVYSEGSLSRMFKFLRPNYPHTMVSVFALKLEPQAWEVLGLTPDEQAQVSRINTVPIGCRVETWGHTQKIVRFRLRVLRQGQVQEEIRDTYDGTWEVVVPLWTMQLGDDREAAEVRLEWSGSQLRFYVWKGRFGGAAFHDGTASPDEKHVLFQIPLPLWPNRALPQWRELEKFRLRGTNKFMGQFMQFDKERGFEWNLTMLTVAPQSLAVVRSTRAGLVKARLYSGERVFFPVGVIAPLLNLEGRRIPRRGELVCLTFDEKSKHVESAFLWGKDDETPKGVYRDSMDGPMYCPNPATITTSTD
jgi:hypothetical protein